MSSCTLTLISCLQHPQKTLLSTPNVEEVFGLTFVASKADGSEVELVPGGAQKFVTDGNKAEYVDAYIQFKLCKENDRQFQAMLSGVSSVVPMHAVRVLAEEELTRAIAGEDTISVLDVKLHCLLTEGYAPRFVGINCSSL